MIKLIRHFLRGRSKSKSPVNFIEVILEFDLDDPPIPSVSAKTCGHIAKYYCQLGGSGLRLPEQEEIPLGVECWNYPRRKRSRVILRLFPATKKDNPKLLIKTQRYVHSPEFKAWVKSFRLDAE